MSAPETSLKRRVEDARWLFNEMEDRIAELEAQVAKLEELNAALEAEMAEMEYPE